MIDFKKEITPDGIAIVSLAGWLEEYSCPYFSSCMQDLVSDGVEEIVIDCSGLGLISSSCLGSLIRSNKRAKGRISLANVSSAPLEVVGFLGLKKLFGIYPSVNVAVSRARLRLRHNSSRQAVAA
ncbi:STAS domain-containing protein [Mariniblastus sp.]|nr:STAS domain-containing protein [Mariniblastus sp.]